MEKSPLCATRFRRGSRSRQLFHARARVWRPIPTRWSARSCRSSGNALTQAIEAALALRSVERSVEEVLLPTLEEIARRNGVESAPWAFAAHWGAEWLRRATRLAPPPVRPVSIVLGDASRDELDSDSPYIRAFELFCVRAGIRVLSLSARGVAGIGDAVAVHAPNLVVLAGGYLSDDTVARWAYSIRLAAGAMPVAVYRRGDQRVRMRTTGTSVLPSGRRRSGSAGARAGRIRADRRAEPHGRFPESRGSAAGLVLEPLRRKGLF